MNPRIPHQKWCCCTPQLYQLSSEKRSIHHTLLSAMFNPLHSIPDLELFEKHLHNPCILKEMVPHVQLYQLSSESEVSVMLCCWICSTRYTAVRIENCLKSTSAIKTATMKNMVDFHYKGKPSCAITKSTLLLSAKINGAQRRTLISP